MNIIKNEGVNNLSTHCILVDSSGVILLDEPICHFKGVGSFGRFYSIFYGKNPASK